MPLAEFKKESLLSGKSLGEYYVVFCQADLNIPLLKKDYSHCYAMKWDGFNWIHFNPALGFTDISVLPQYDDDIRLALANERYTDIIHVSAWRKIRRWRTPWPVAFTCVEQIKALLGISAWWVITPWQLYKYLGGHHGDTVKQT
jgi:hypothetical protein